LIDNVNELNDTSEEERTCSQQGEDDLNDVESERDNDEGLYEVQEVERYYRCDQHVHS
jgi:hypothetical protein